MKGYRFGDAEVGDVHHCFRALEELKRFVKEQGGGRSRYFEVEGDFLRDEGGPDGLVLRVRSVREIRL